MSKTDFLQKVQSLFWDIKNIHTLSDTVIEERILQYGNWEDVLSLIALFGKDHFTDIYREITTKNRVNLSEKTIHFFNLYLDV